MKLAFPSDCASVGAQPVFSDLLRSGVSATLSLFLALLTTMAPVPALAADDSWKAALGDASELLPDLREEIVRIPQRKVKSTDKVIPLTGTLFQPMGNGPFPVVVLSHGSPGRAADRDLMGRYRVIPQIRALVGQGLAVLVPMRRGYGASGGDYVESIGYCEMPRYQKTGEESSRDLLAAVNYIHTRPSLDATKIVLMGQSAGGFASIAAGSMALKGVVAVANFSGGRGGNGMNGVPCRPDLMGQVIANYAKTLRVPVLWFYVENDKYFGPVTAKAWFAEFESAGGKGRLVVHPPYGNDGHLLFYSADAVPIWIKVLNDFLKDVGLASLTGTP